MDNIPGQEKKVKSYRVAIFNDLLRDGHYQKMGISLWTYLLLIDKTTIEKIDPGTGRKIGLVFNGKEVSIRYLAGILKVNYRTIRRHLKILEKEGYIFVRRGSRGIKITIFDSRKWEGKVDRSVQLEKSSEWTEMSTQVDRSVQSRVDTNVQSENQKITPNPLNSQGLRKLSTEGDISVIYNKTSHLYRDDSFLDLEKDQKLISIAEQYLEVWRKLNPTVKYPKRRLAELLRPLFERLGYATLIDLIYFAFGDEFWKKRILSPENFIRRWGKIHQAMGGSKAIPESAL